MAVHSCVASAQLHGAHAPSAQLHGACAGSLERRLVPCPVYFVHLLHFSVMQAMLLSHPVPQPYTAGRHAPCNPSRPNAATAQAAALFADLADHCRATL